MIWSWPYLFWGNFGQKFAMKMALKINDACLVAGTDGGHQVKSGA